MLVALLLLCAPYIAHTQLSQKAIGYITSQEGPFTEVNLSSDDLRISSSHVSSISGVEHIYFQHLYDGIDIINSVGSVHFDRSGDVAHATNSFVDIITPQRQNLQVDAVSAVNTAGTHFNLPRISQTRILSAPSSGTDAHHILSNSDFSTRDIRARLVYLVGESGMTLSWEVFLEKPDDGFMWLAYVDATDGSVSNTESLTIECTFESCNQDNSHTHSTPRTSSYIPSSTTTPNSYGVFAIPLEAPNEGDASIETAPWLNAPLVASPFGWHDTDGVGGAEFTITRGNNVFAVEDRDGNNNTIGESPDGGADLIFDFPFDPELAPEDYVDFAITNLFYMNNIMHDVTYQYGFDEAAGNFQVNNYGNGGQDGDEVLADAQDGSGTNNATFGTPVDGGNPRMTMFEWTGGGSNELSVNAPGNVSGNYVVGGAAFNPDMASVTEQVTLADPIDACLPITNSDDIFGTIAMIDRGECTFVEKVLAAQEAGALGVVICNNNPGEAPITMAGDDPSITIPSVMLSFEDCELLKIEIDNGLNVTIDVQAGVNRDSDLDNGIIAHEYGHGISNRLTGGAGNGNCIRLDEQMGEGWSDYFGLMMQIKQQDLPEDPNGIGTYVIFQPPSGGGIRPWPYSTDLNVNPSSYNDISQVSIPHGVGTVWCTMLWDMTWELIQKHGFSPDPYDINSGNGIAMQLVMEGLKLQPCQPGFVDGRDAILEADLLLFGGDNSCEIWRAFAKRGLGIDADQGNPNAVNDGTESFRRPPGCPDELVQPCTDEVLVYSEETIPDATNERINTVITIESSAVSRLTNVELRAREAIDIFPDFEVERRGELFLKAIPCDDSGSSLAPLPESEEGSQK